MPLERLVLLSPTLLGRNVQANWVTVLIPRFRWARISFSDMPRIKAQVVSADRLGMAAIPELAGWAVVVQDHQRR